MPVLGLVVCLLPERLEEVKKNLEAIEGVEVWGWNEFGEMVVVYEGDKFEEMEREVEDWPRRIEGVLAVNVAYLNVEDELERIESGKVFFKRPWQ